ncbi:hypothetical protein [Dichotomicrobium thermohalophilum]|uniref:Uncharacterized protein n=1 Tax=Dichotomicrobium thermohalophilum TaxID=933063 RepID=A0A397PE71_9HYPH|nr:hypothetical protein [Dichotomicrobium thermohalophilum]RIA47312.1 hypothetical protein BXY53_2386 [Dichotomicrobium thermohalophilum]
MPMQTQSDLLHKLREAQRHLIEAARAIDGASIHVGTLIEAVENSRNASKGENDDA